MYLPVHLSVHLLAVHLDRMFLPSVHRVHLAVVHLPYVHLLPVLGTY